MPTTEFIERQRRNRKLIKARERGASYRALAEEFGISPARAQEIVMLNVRREQWRRMCKADPELIDGSTRTMGALYNAKVFRYNDLTAWSARELLKLRNFGPKSLAEVRRLLAARGLHLLGDTKPPTVL